MEETKKLSREEIFQDLKQTAFFLIKMKKDSIYQENKKNVKTLQGMSVLQEEVDQMDLEIQIFLLLEAAGVEDYNKLDSFYNQIQEGLELPKDQHNAIVSMFGFIDDEYNNQSKQQKEDEQSGE